jgi:anaerobic ribonucleoside-triphosphate reductase activating protein
MNIHSRLPGSTVNGPGNRAVVWFQGCQTMSCSKTCWNPDTHSITAGREMSVSDLSDWILNLFVDGVTFSGGEPMQQAGDLWKLITTLRGHQPGISLGMYTGYTELELSTGRYLILSTEDKDKNDRLKGYLWEDIRQHLDFAVMGRYNHLLKDTSRPLCSSKNQKLALFSHRYCLSDFQPLQMEVHIDSDSLVTITGFPMERVTV